MFIVVYLALVGHKSNTENHAKSINENVPRLSPPRQLIVKRTGGVVKEKNESERGRKGTGENGVIEAHAGTRMTKPVCVIVIAGGNVVSQQAASFAKLGLLREAHAAHSQATETNG
jgi:hypothetical protein